MAQGPQAQRIEALEKQVNELQRLRYVYDTKIFALESANMRLEADLRALRGTVDQLLIARNQGAGMLALLEDAQIVEPTEEEKQAEEDRKALLEYLRKVDADG